ncbi:MAG: MATE family efflux transporter [Armatimonadetes bacterium]|nr:MATE family efflux transporter [Armatimonadota bacterium]
MSTQRVTPVSASDVAAKLDTNKPRAEILEGPLAKSVFMLAYPSVATMLLQTTNGFLDRFFVGHLESGPAAQAAVTVSSSLLFALMAAGMAISVGTTALVARAIGEGDRESAVKAAEQSLMLSLILSVLIAVPMWLFRTQILTAFGLQPEAQGLAGNYLGVTILGLPTLFSMLAMNGAFRGMGDTVRPFYVTLGANLVHAFLNYCLIFGNFGFPALGLVGGAVALICSQAVATALYAFFIRNSDLGAMNFFPRVEWDWIKRIGKIGLPASGQQIVRVGSMMIFQILLARLGAGDAAVAALGVGLMAESIAFMPGFGYSIAASAFVGQNLGANNPKRAAAGGWAATWQAVAIMSLMGVLFWIFAENFARFFVPHLPGETVARAESVEATVALIVSYLRVAAWSEPFLALGMVITGALQGAGETISPAYITVATMLVMRVSLCYFVLTAGYGTEAAWWVMSVSTMVQGVATAYLFKRGNWQTKRV